MVNWLSNPTKLQGGGPLHFTQTFPFNISAFPELKIYSQTYFAFIWS